MTQYEVEEPRECLWSAGDEEAEQLGGQPKRLLQAVTMLREDGWTARPQRLKGELSQRGVRDILQRHAEAYGGRSCRLTAGA